MRVMIPVPAVGTAKAKSPGQGRGIRMGIRAMLWGLIPKAPLTWKFSSTSTKMEMTTKSG